MPECIVVGGGIIGLLTARSLSSAGVDVLLIESGKLGGESSWAGGGIISPLYPWRYADSVNHLAERSKQIYPSLLPELLDETGIDCEFLNSGLFVLEKNNIESILAWGKKWSVSMQAIDTLQEIKELEPTVANCVDQGVWLPEVMQVRNPKLVQALKSSFSKRKIPYLEQTPVLEITYDDNVITGVRTKDKTFSANKVIIASGAWSAKFLPVEASVNVQPVKGQMIMYKGKADLLKRIVLSEGHYVIPRKDGRILAGSTLEKIGFDKSISQVAQQELHQAAVELIPMLENLEIERQWAGLRPGTENGIPYICSHSDIEGLFVHAGHYRNGIVLGAASAEKMTGLITGELTDDDLREYSMTAVH